MKKFFNIPRLSVWLQPTVLCLFLLSSCTQNNRELTFAYMGDLHYNLDQPEVTDSLVKAVAEEMKSLENKPAFLLQTGDFFHAGRGVNVADEASMAFEHFQRDIGMPFYIAKGNHDSKQHYEKNALPLFTKTLGVNINRSYYSFDAANCHFIMLDCTESNYDEMLSWLKNDLEAARSNDKTEHIFAAAHEPLWIVARAGFNDAEKAKRLTEMLAGYKIDAFFCGHTHNKTVTVRSINGTPVTQIMDAAVVEKGRLQMLAPFLAHVAPKPADRSRPGILALEEGHQVFIPKSELLYYHGYQEGSTTSWYIITVRKNSVQADWHVLGQGVVHSFSWDSPGKLVDLVSPPKVEKPAVAESDLQKITKAWLYAAPWIEKDSVMAPIRINGIPAGSYDLNRRKMAASPFWNKVEVPLSEDVIDAIVMNNVISISNPSEVRFGLAHLFILVQFEDGRFARTNISSKVLTSFIPEEGKYLNFPKDELIDPVGQGKDLANVELKFENYY